MFILHHRLLIPLQPQAQAYTEMPLFSLMPKPGFPEVPVFLVHWVPSSRPPVFLAHWVPSSCPHFAQVSALRRLAKPMSERVAGRVGSKPPNLDSGAEVSASTTSSEAESGARSVSSIVRQWNRKINHFLGDHPAAAVNGTRPAR